MGALAKVKENIKDSKIGLVIGGALGAFISMVNSVEEEENDDVNKAIEKTIKENPNLSEELTKTAEAINFEQEKLTKQAEKRFNTSKTFELEKDEDGYNKIQDKLQGIEAEVSEQKAIEKRNERAKGGKQKTRVDED